MPHDTGPSLVRIFAALLGGAVLVLASGFALEARMPGDSPNALLPATEQDRAVAARLQGHVRALAGPRNLKTGDTLSAALRYVEDTLRGEGLSPRDQPFESIHGPTRNIEVVLPARRGDTAPIVVLGAHVDTDAHSATPGADDNASGVAVLLELARGLAAGSPAALLAEYEVRIVFYANEEPPYFNDTSRGMGSVVHAQSLLAEKRAVAWMLSIESVGVWSDAPGTQVYPLAPLAWFYPDRGNFAAFVGDPGVRDPLRRLVGAFRAGARVPSVGFAASVTGNDFSDHRSYRQAGFPALMVTGTANLRGVAPGERVPMGAGFAKHARTVYHTKDDVPEHLNYVAMAQLVEGLGRMLAQPGVW